MKLVPTSHLLALAGVATARVCLNATVPVTITSRNAVFNIAVPGTNFDVPTFVQNATRQGANFTQLALAGYANVAGTYNISAQFCRPTNATAKKPVIQILTHGIGFDKTYWDLPYNDYNYSYVSSAVEAEYCTLSYDRLGIGNSSHGEPLNEIQSHLEIQALRALTALLRTGAYPGVRHAFGRDIVHVGHSFGAAQTYAFASMYPDETAAIVLTGFSANASFLPYFAAGANLALANTNQPGRLGRVDARQLLGSVAAYIAGSPLFDLLQGIDLAAALRPGAGYPDGYLVSSDVQALQYLFLHPGHFDRQLLVLAEASKQPVTLGELLTLRSLPATSSFLGPVLVLTGQYDVPYCGGDCLATGGAMASIPAGVGMSFTNKSNFEAYIQPNMGHGINLQYNATGAYNVITNYLQAKGLKTS